MGLNGLWVLPCERCEIYLSPDYDPRDCEGCSFADESIVFEP